MMGSGKTTIGKGLSKMLNLPFYDLDDLIEKKSGLSVSDYFGKYGEDSFRMLEKECLHLTSVLEGAVISTGGGTPCFFDNMEVINNCGISFYLKANEKLLHSRLKESKSKRPLISDLTEDQLIENIMGLLTKRESFYLKAKYTVSAIDPYDEILQILKSLIS